MRRWSGGIAAAMLAAAVATAACSSTAQGPGAAPPGVQRAARAPTAAAAADSNGPRPAAADVAFMQRMVPHHAQALVMTSLVPARTRSAAIRLLAERIELSQRDEIALMRGWLESRGQEAPSLEARHGHHRDAGREALMPGMLTAVELARLAGATGAEFDRLFLLYMIRHHEGAVTMVAELLATPGAGQDSELFRFASDVDADQRAEIRRMRTVLDALPAGMPRR